MTQRVSWICLPWHLPLLLCSTLLAHDLSDQSQGICLKLQRVVYVPCCVTSCVLFYTASGRAHLLPERYQDTKKSSFCVICLLFMITWERALLDSHLATDFGLFKQLLCCEEIYFFTGINVFQNHIDCSPFQLNKFCFLWRFVGVN